MEAVTEYKELLYNGKGTGLSSAMVETLVVEKREHESQADQINDIPILYLSVTVRLAIGSHVKFTICRPSSAIVCQSQNTNEFGPKSVWSSNRPTEFCDWQYSSYTCRLTSF